ncbi:PAS domain S-box protein [Haloarcula sp. 1CSR25-25]|uniref:PAS domain S-box protein n=1 Tax=Haloarcula sp. 1CSR25-25 TaxID=2862545 RepID=UPI0028A00307|nr:PAS domain S-box protein [Haloarcula sp. 1CSR25-25]
MSRKDTDRIHLLYVDDEPDFADLAATLLERKDSQFTVATVTSASDGLDRLADTAFDCIISDYDMPGQNGIEFLETVREEYPDLPFILYTGKGSEEVASDAILAGVTDYLQKGSGTDQYTVLANRARNAVEGHRSQRALAERNQELRRYKQAVNSMHEAACIYDTAGQFELVNEYLADWYGKSPEALEGEASALIPRIREQTDGDPYQALLDGTRDELKGELDGDFPGHGYAVLAYRLTPLRVNGTVDGIVGVARDITDRRERQAELERKDRAMDAAPVGISISDPSQEDNPLIYVNERFTELTGYAGEEVLGSNCRFLQGEHTNLEPVARMREAIDDEEPVTVELRNYRKDGTEFYNRVSIAPVQDEDGEVITYVGFQQDVTEDKEREQEYERVVELLNHTEQIADVGGWEIDPDTQDVFWTDHLFEMVAGDYDEEPPLEDALNLYIEADRPRVETAVETALAAGDPFDVEARFRRSDGDIGWFRIRGEPTIEDNKVVTLRGAVQDITDYKEREQELQRIQTFFQEAERLGNLGAWEFSADGTVVWTDGTRRIHEVGDEYEPTLEEGLEFFHPEDRDQIVETIENALATGKPYDLEVRLITAEGNERWVRTRGKPVEGTEDTVRGYIQDITDRKHRERQLERQNDRLDEFASVVSHDLRSPLSVVEGRLTLAREDCESTHLDPIGDAVERMNSIIDGVLWLAREGRDIDETGAVVLQQVIEDAWSIVTDDQGEAELILTDNPDGWKPISADRDRLRQLLENLFRNAIDHAGPNVTVRVETMGAGFAIEDDGPGIPEAERERVFESGYSTAGIGFGLAIVRQVAEAHGWEVRVTDGSEDGARFEITGVEFTTE